MTISEFSCLATCNGLRVKKYQAGPGMNKGDFLAAIKETCGSTTKIMVVSYCRKTLKQTGDGHFSPIGGYDEDTNTVLVMDVARFKVRTAH